MEVGPTANLAPWSWLPDGVDDAVREVGYTFDTMHDDELLTVWVLYARIHRDLIDVTYRYAEAAHRDGTLIVRPMVFAYPDQPDYGDLWS